MTGYAAIGLIRPKTSHNIGGIFRAAHNYSVASVLIEGPRCDLNKATHQASNTLKTHRHIPIISVESIKRSIPAGAMPVAIDLVDDAESLVDFEHPRTAFYVFGPEDGTLGKSVLEWCPRRVMVPTQFCMNLAATVNVVLYDRLAKHLRKREADEV
jgi:tRNA(Leu) C34 or U34 (ribose-2'-O)-methylase TrmL